MTRYSKTVVFVLSFLLVIICCFAESGRAEKSSVKSAGHEAESIVPLAASQMILERKDLVVVDVRTPREREQASIEDSIHIGMGDIFQNNISVPKEQPILLYCAVGGRSLAAAKWLKMKGYENVYNLEGGIDAWQKAGLAVIRGGD